MKQKKLILLTSEFPYGNGETFLETEIHYLAEEFEEIIIISNHYKSEVSRDVPENCTVRYFDIELSKSEKLRSLQLLLSKEFKAEKKYVQDQLKLSVSKAIRNTALVSLFRGKKIKANLIKINGSTDFSRTVCYSYWCNDNAMALALLQEQFPEVKTVSRAHRWDLYFEASQFNYLPYRNYIANGLSELFPISQQGHDYVVNRWKTKIDTVKIRRLGSIGGKQISAASKLKIVSCSNIIPVKRVDLIASALSIVKGFELEWVHFGNGTEIGKVKSILESLPANIQVSLLGQKSNSEILEWYKNNGPGLFINVSTSEGIPVSIMEAMSFGTPVLATDVGGTSEIVNSKNGELLSVDVTANEVALRIKAFFELTKEQQDAKREAAFKTWSSIYDAEKNYADFAKELSA